MVENQQSVVRNDALIWRAIGCSVRGAAHKRSGLPNQDAMKYWPDNGEGSPLILAVADGHGSSKYFRSDHGARIAVDIALRVLQAFAPNSQEQTTDSTSISEHSIELVERGLDLSNPTVAGRMAEEQLPKLLSRRWLESVEEHIQNHPLKTDELQKLADSDPEAAAELKSNGVVTPIAYGTTLVTVVITESFILYLQIGDGDILIVTDAELVHRPITGDNRLFGNETTSLCAKEAWKDFRIKIQPTIDSPPPALILVSTDGYANSFRDDESFQKVGPDILQMADQYGLDGIEKKLQTWLDEASQTGSGDDITLGVLKPLRGSDRDVVARKADAALTFGEEAHKRASEAHDQLASLTDDFTTTKKAVEERLKPLELSIGAIAALQEQIAKLNERETRYEFFERRLRRFWWVLLSSVVILIAAEVLFYVASARREAAAQVPNVTPTLRASPAPTLGTRDTTEATPTPSISPNSNNESTNRASVSDLKSNATQSKKEIAPKKPRTSGGSQKRKAVH
jgi:serine/threonine protein phosphatase PrpC